VDEISLKIHAVEDHRHRCEVSEVLRWRVEDRNKAVSYFSLVRKKRGDVVATKLEQDCKNQWAKGNRGQRGDWK